MRGTLKNDEYFAEKAESGSLPSEKTKKLVLYCQIGRKSREIDEDLLEGRECYSLEGGYIAIVLPKKFSVMWTIDLYIQNVVR